VEAAPFAQTLRVAARVVVDERRISTVSLRYGGLDRGAVGDRRWASS
jgi:hypothetical protein